MVLAQWYKERSERKAAKAAAQGAAETQRKVGIVAPGSNGSENGRRGVHRAATLAQIGDLAGLIQQTEDNQK